MSGRRGRAGSWTVVAALAVLVPVTGCASGGGRSQAVPPLHTVDAAPLVHTSESGRIDPSRPYTVTSEGAATLTDVTLTGSDGRTVGGQLAADRRSWQTSGQLRAGTSYTVRISADDGKGGRGDTTSTFSTAAAGNLLTAELGPDSAGSGLYGVGQPLTVKLSAPVKDPAARQEVERGLRVATDPAAVVGAWYWVDDRNLHFRPKDYWPANSRVKLTFDRAGVRIADGLFGGAPATLSLRTGDRVEAIVDASTDHLTYKRNGQVVNTIPITTGKPGFDTRNGVKVVLGQESLVRMQSETIGISKDSHEAYDLQVHWATRLTWSGEFVHAAPWSVDSQGRENVSHGCTGMSTDNAYWFFQNTRIGDIVQTINSKGHPMEPFGNGFGDWNISWEDWQKHGATGKPVTTASLAQGEQPAGGLVPVL